MARDIPSADTDVPKNYLVSQTRLTLLTVVALIEPRKLLEKLKIKKVTGLDNLPSKMLKIVSGMKVKNDHRSIFSNLSNCSSYMNYFSSVGRASHRYRGDHGFESR